ncbi:hypothetical protein CTEN210_12477 [Chaetoceros tenuissimus]|uniref:Uncharacterized protein n=1 Tax=Chaetoceros tenuissimus TaxID=426638 RepID=A0AAD3D3C2_9STRA|nr:hypothetical protein CTEN210_12477 [Chaetoceros tenuissimus]
MNSREIAFELSHYFNEWGVSSSEKTHRIFRRQAVIAATNYFHSQGDLETDLEELEETSFPTNLNDAFRFYLQNENVASPLYGYIDHLDMNGRQPYYRTYNKGKRKYEYHLKQQFEGFEEQCDPFTRFEFQRLEKEELFFSTWMIEDDDVQSAFKGKVIETWLLCHALQHERCFNCKTQGSLRFNNYSNSPWQDMICCNKECSAMYKITTKENKIAMDKSFFLNRFICGSFQEFCRERNTENRKMFLVVLPRQGVRKEIPEIKHLYYPVWIGEIQKGLPHVYHATFNPNLDDLRFKTVVSIIPGSETVWFDLPCPLHEVDVYGIAKTVFIKRFSQATFDFYSSEYFGDQGGDSEDDGGEKIEEKL